MGFETAGFRGPAKQGVRREIDSVAAGQDLVDQLKGQVDEHHRWFC